jgi:hypothetical protein
VFTNGKSGGEKRCAFAPSIACDRVHIRPDEPAVYFPELLVQERRVFPCGLPLKCFQEIVLEIVSHAMLICHPSRLPRVGHDGHHDDDAASVLGTVQGAALRSARAYARPSGLDGACAQMVGRHLRDGRRMLFPSGTNGALIDPSGGLEKHSRLFHRFRTRAFHELC